MSNDWRVEDALTDGPACVCNALPYEHGWQEGRCFSLLPMPPLGGVPIFDPYGPGIIGWNPAPPPVRRSDQTIENQEQ